MKIKTLIEILKQIDPEQRVVVDLLDGPYDIHTVNGNGGLGKARNWEPVTWLSLDGPIKKERKLPLDDSPKVC